MPKSSFWGATGGGALPLDFSKPRTPQEQAAVDALIKQKAKNKEPLTPGDIREAERSIMSKLLRK